MTHTISGDGTTAVDPDYFFRSLDTAPMGVSVWLLTVHGKAIDGQLTGRERDIVAWCPKPKIPPHIKALMR